MSKQGLTLQETPYAKEEKKRPCVFSPTLDHAIAQSEPRLRSEIIQTHEL